MKEWKGIFTVFKLFFVVIFLFIMGCSAAYKAVKQGDELVQMKNYYGGAKEYLTALRLEPDNKDAKMKLCQYSQNAYDQKLQMCAGSENSADYENALSHYTELSSFMDNTRSYNCLNFPTIPISTKITEMRSGASEKYYREAETLFSTGDFANAIPKYKDALRHNSPYKDSINKTAECHFQLGAKSEANKKFRQAAMNYVDAISVIKGYKDAIDRSATIYCSLGDHFLERKLCRNAYNDYSEVAKINPNYPDISDKLKQSEECAISKIAFIKFDNPTKRDISGMSIGDFIFDDIMDKLQNRSSKFVRVIERNELENVMNEQKMGAGGITDEFSSFQKLRGVQYLVFGKLTQVRSERPQIREENMRTTGTEAYRCVERGRDGKYYESTCSRNVPVGFTRYTERISVGLAGSIKVVKVLNGEQIISHNISTKRDDSVVYADNFTRDLSSVDLERSIIELSRARRELRDEDALVKEIVTEISNEMVGRILDKIDRDASVSDPVDLKLQLQKIVGR